MIHLGRLSLLGTGIVFGGVTLGAALASYANPLPRAAEPPPWHSSLSPQIAVGDTQPFTYSMPEDLTVATTSDRYAPPSAFTELRWPVEQLPEAEIEAAAFPVDAGASRTATANDYAAMADRPIAAPHYAEIEQAAATSVTPAEPSSNDVASANVVKAPPVPTGGVRIIDIAEARAG